jgi:23S rRNA pseudouridine1911/1915/1917 synthase
MKVPLTLLPNVSLDELLVEGLGLSRARVKKLLSELDEKSLKKRLNKRDPRSTSLSLPIDLINAREIAPTYTAKLPEIIFEDEDFIVLNKPCGVHGHSLVYTDQEVLTAFLRAENKFEALRVAPELRERGMLFRLDRETSGVVIFCKNKSLFTALRDPDCGFSFHKTYIALCSKKPAEVGMVEFNFSPSGAKGHKMLATREGEGRLGRCEIKLLGEHEGVYLVKLELFEGIRHQLRASMSALGAPLIGDELYGGPTADRLALHAHTYSIAFPGGEVKAFSASVDNLFQSLLDRHGLLQVFENEIGIGDR